MFCFIVGFLFFVLFFIKVDKPYWYSRYWSGTNLQWRLVWVILSKANDTSVKPRFNEPLFNEVLDITNDILRPEQSYSKMYGIEPRYNEPRCNEFFDVTHIFRKPKRKIYLDRTNYNDGQHAEYLTRNSRQTLNISSVS